MIADADAERLAHVAVQLVARLRDEDPEAVARWLCCELDGLERWQLLFVLAAMVPTDQTPAQLLAWVWHQQRQEAARKVLDEMAPKGARAIESMEAA